jgi:hypothetical protein
MHVTVLTVDQTYSYVQEQTQTKLENQTARPSRASGAVDERFREDNQDQFQCGVISS